MLRRFGEPPPIKPPDKEILLLRYFHRQYTKAVKDALENPLKIRFGEETTLVSSLNSQSPQLVEQRLYAAIRCTKVCIADWTGWRPNVFFEIGVRLAVSPYDPVMVFCTEKSPHWDDKKSEWPFRRDQSIPALEDFFKPTKFHLGDVSPLKDRLDLFDENQPSRGTEAKLSPGRTYRLVAESVERRYEPGGQSVEDLLLSEAKAIAGPAVADSGGLTGLFADTLAEQVRRAAIELELAAWYYLDGRYTLTQLLSEQKLDLKDDRLQALKRVGREIKNRLGRKPPEEYQAIRRKVEDVLATIEDAERSIDHV